MRAFFLISCLAVTAVMAHPEPPVPYGGLQQQNQRALPLNVHAAKPHVYQQLPKELSFGGFENPAMTYGAPDNIVPVVGEARNMPEMNTLEDSYNAAFRHSSTQHQSGYANAPTETQVHKHIYVHVPPKDFEEDDAAPPRVTHQIAPKQKHYKIVFIKAPSAPAIRAPVVPPPPQNEEKTLIYVLHKKPDAQADIVIPSPPPTKPSKPEVYFIKYKTKKDEAPVYGPPPGTFISEPRLAAEPSAEYAAPLSNDIQDFISMDPSQYEQQITTAQPAVEDVQPQFMTVEQAAQFPEVYNAPTMSAFVGEESHTTVAEPSNQYLAPETTSAPIVVAEMEENARTPAANYGPPGRFFVKRKK